MNSAAPEKRARASLRSTVEKVARELALQTGRDEGLWELHHGEAQRICIREPDRALTLVRAYAVRKRQGATRA